MNTRLFAMAALFFSIFLATAAASIGQIQPAPKPTPTKADVIYTGKLLGYFRVPSIQEFNATQGCPNYQADLSSDAARKFMESRDGQDKDKTVLVGSGDNFAPELEARVFSNPPPSGNAYAAGNKELYMGSTNNWEFYATASEQLKNKIAAGYGTIPNDNVACFLRRAKYAAIVPGKHDFYFGPERVRQFARFLAGDRTLAAPASDDTPARYYEPVQMLGANLVMTAEPIEGTEVSAKVKADHKFSVWPAAYPVMNLSDGHKVYPWFSVIRIKLIDFSRQPTIQAKLKELADKDDGTLDLDKFTRDMKDIGKVLEEDQRTLAEKRLTSLKENLDSLKLGSGIRICKAEGRGTPNELPDNLSTCDQPESTEIRVVENSIVLYVYLKKTIKTDANSTAEKHFSTLESAKNFGLCSQVHDPDDAKKIRLKNACMRFSSYTPFFYFPHQVPNEKPDGYIDPEPYVIQNNVAIFGVVDPSLAEQVGTLNFGWIHKDHPELTITLSAEDPAEALQQQLDYFKIEHPGFAGLKILLTQMPPHRARALAARFPEFQIVVSGADQDLATSNIKMSSHWKRESPATAAFLAVPTPYFDSVTRKGTVHYGTIHATPEVLDLVPKKTEWELSATAFAGMPVNDRDDPAEDFWKRVKKLPGGCLPAHFDREQQNESYDNQTYLKLLTLCAMQQHLGSDIALIQTRDLYEKIPLLQKDTTQLINRANLSDKDAQSDENLQQTVDRLIWKGDFIRLLVVPGSAIKKALKQSDQFESAQRATLSLSVERGRKLETLGIREDNGEYFINELPINNDHPYIVATTDYIGAGDTGYPDLVKAARNPATHPATFPGELVTISSLVCSKLVKREEIAKYCLGPVISRKYLDESIVQQIPPYPAEGHFSKLWSGTGLAWPDAREPSKDPAVGVEQRVQRRSFWGFALNNLSIGVSDLDNNRTDDSLEEHFAGVSTSGVDSKKNRSLSLDIDTRLSYFADHHEFFLASGVDYQRKSQGDPVLATGISLDKNKVFANPGVVWWRHPGREFPNVGFVASVYGETQLEQPFSAFNLKTETEDQIRITQRRGLLVTGRLGFRWQNRVNSFEFGGQGGREFRALEKYHFENPGGTPVECPVSSTITLKKCIEDNSTPPNGLIVAGSIPSAVLQGRPRAGIYWDHNLSIPLGDKVKYEVTQDADFFFVNWHKDTSIDTRFRYNSKNTLSFMVWPNFSIGPVLELFMYQNKVNRSFLFQRTFGIETKINFEIFNRREKKAQVIARP